MSRRVENHEQIRPVLKHVVGPTHFFDVPPIIQTNNESATWSVITEIKKSLASSVSGGD